LRATILHEERQCGAPSLASCVWSKEAQKVAGGFSEARCVRDLEVDSFRDDFRIAMIVLQGSGRLSQRRIPKGDGIAESEILRALGKIFEVLSTDLGRASKTGETKQSKRR
jgi:hypothetical protein